MADVSIRDLRNRGGEIVDRAARGEAITITRDGRPVAELRSLDPPPLGAEELLRRSRGIPTIDLSALRADIDAVIDPSL